MFWSVLSTSALAHIPILYIAGPSDDWCAVINGTIGNDIVLLSPGEYRGPCDIIAKESNVSGEQTTVSSFDPLDPAVFTGSDSDYVLSVSGESLMLLEILFRDLPQGVDAVRAGPIRALWVKRAWFHSLGDAIVHEGLIDDLRVTETEFISVEAPAVLGCAGACPISYLDVSSNLVMNNAEPLTVSSSAAGTLRDNVVVGAGAGLRLEGLGSALEITGNLVDAAGPALVVGAGTALVGSNVLLGAPALEVPGSASDVEISGNTLKGALDLEGWDASQGLSFVGNAVQGELPSIGGALGSGNIACDASCFVDADSWDFYPAAGSPLRGAGAAGLGEDWCGRERSPVPAAGAFEVFGETSFGPLLAAFKDQTDCTLPTSSALVETGDTGTATLTLEPTSPPNDPPPIETKDPSRGCSTANGSASVLALLIASLGLFHRRTPRRSDVYAPRPAVALPSA